jgi:geranylgeranyl pyrophosphate synthase
LQLKAIYELIEEDLAQVDGQFKLLINDNDNTFPELRRMLNQILIAGKIVRPALTLLAGKFYNYNFEKLLPMATASELLHIATLVHDDAIDKASIRRGRPTINKIWGTDKAIILGDYLFARAGESAAATENLRVVRLFAQTLETISKGELKQSFSAFNFEQTFDQYLQRVSGKTASLFAMAAESGAVLSNAPEESIQILKRYGFNLGIAFQIIDDVLDFIGVEEEMGKPVGSDLIQGTITLPSLMLLELYPKDNPVKRHFQNEGNKQENITEAIELVVSSGIVDECYRVALDYCTQARQGFERLPNNSSRQALLKLTEYVVERKK